MVDHKTPVAFTGKAGEYFGIWIVNLFLSIVTLGIYSAWAKVRRKKYFYHHTLIDGIGFDYHAKPITILKGRLIAFVLFVIYNILAGTNPVIAAVLLILFFVALPWIVTRGLMFNARNSSHRGLRFDFDGKYGQAALVFLVFPLLIIVTLGLAFPFVMRQINKYMFDHHKFGTSHFAMEASIKDFYMVYLKLFGAVLLIGVLLSFGLKGLMPGGSPHLSATPSADAQMASYLNQQGGFIKVGLTEAPADATSEAADAALTAVEEAIAADEEAYSNPKEYANESAASEDYLKDLTPEERAQLEAEMENIAKQLEAQAGAEMDTEAPPENPLDAMLGPLSVLGPLMYGVIFLVVLIYAVLLLGMTAYVQSRISNLMWNNTTLDHLSFHSNQRMRDLLWLYMSNTLVLILTLGLATPWAQIRMANYRMSHLKIFGENDWDKFVGEKKENARAMGEEIAEMFDVDLSFG